MFQGHRLSKRTQELESGIIPGAHGNDKFDDFGMPLNNASTGKDSNNKKGFFNRFKSTSSKTSQAHDENSSDEDGSSFDVIPGVSNASFVSPNENIDSPRSSQGFPQGPQGPLGQLGYPQGHPQGFQQGYPQGPQGFPQGPQGPPQGYPHGPQVPPQGHPQAPPTGQAPVSAGHPNPYSSQELHMDQLSSLPDRFRYPTVDGSRKSGTLSMTSMSNYDSTPIIPMLSTPVKPTTKKNPQDDYRHKVIDSRNALMSAETTVPYTGDPNRAGQIPQPPHQMPPKERTMSMNSMSSNGRGSRVGFNSPYGSVYNPQFNPPPMAGPNRPMSPAQMGKMPTGPNVAPMMPPPMFHGPGMNSSARNSSSNLSLNSNGGMRSSVHAPISPALSVGPNSPQLGRMQMHPQPHYPASTIPMGQPPMASMGPGMVPGMRRMDRPDPLIADLRAQNSSLEDSIRVLSVELAESARREMKLPTEHEPPTTVIAQAHNELTLLRNQLKTLESNFNSHNRGDEAAILKRITELEHRHSEATHLLSIRTEQYENLQQKLETLETQFDEKSAELVQANAELRDKAALETDQDETGKLSSQVRTLQIENDKLKSQLKEQSPKGTLKDRISALEDQRKALQEALRTMKESKDMQIQTLNAKIEALRGNDVTPNKSVTRLSNLYSENGSSKLSLIDDKEILTKAKLNVHKFPRFRSITPLEIGTDYN